jgi:large subunit ribosomal protein L29
MEIDKIRNMSDDELKGEEAKAAEQLFRIRFAKSLGKQEGIGKIKSLKLDIARFKTIAKQRLLATAKAGKE